MADLSVESILSGSVNSEIAGELGPVGPVPIAGIPDHYTFTIDELPKIQISVDPQESKLTLEPVTLKIAPIESSISIKEIPSLHRSPAFRLPVGRKRPSPPPMVNSAVLIAGSLDEVLIRATAGVGNECSHGSVRDGQ